MGQKLVCKQQQGLGDPRCCQWLFFFECVQTYYPSEPCIDHFQKLKSKGVQTLTRGPHVACVSCYVEGVGCFTWHMRLPTWATELLQSYPSRSHHVFCERCVWPTSHSLASSVMPVIHGASSVQWRGRQNCGLSPSFFLSPGLGLLS